MGKNILCAVVCVFLLSCSFQHRASAEDHSAGWNGLGPFMQQALINSFLNGYEMGVSLFPVYHQNILLKEFPPEKNMRLQKITNELKKNKSQNSIFIQEYVHAAYKDKKYSDISYYDTFALANMCYHAGLSLDISKANHGKLVEKHLRNK